MPLSDFPLRATIAVSDIQRAAAFYEGKLGLRALRSGPSAKIPDVWYVDDIDQIVDELTAAGVQFTRYDEFDHDAKGITPRAGGGRIAWFQDPDGNTLAIEADV